jgi:hypothetical protein
MYKEEKLIMVLKLTGSQVFQLGGYLKDFEQARNLNFSTRRKLMNFNKVLQPEFELIREEASKITREFAEKDENGEPVIEENGFKFSEENKKVMMEKLGELEKEEISIEFEHFNLPEEVFDNFACSADMIEVIERTFLEKIVRGL